jgi:hypothetical protein
MKFHRTALLAACFLGAIPGAIPASAGTNADAADRCIPGERIDHTTVLDDQTILFVMRDHTVFRNRFPVRCLGLKNEARGFTYAPTDPGTEELCSNQMTIRLNTSRSVCQIGAFEKMPKGFKG